MSTFPRRRWLQGWQLIPQIRDFGTSIGHVLIAASSYISSAAAKKRRGHAHPPAQMEPYSHGRRTSFSVEKPCKWTETLHFIGEPYRINVNELKVRVQHCQTGHGVPPRLR